MSRLHTWSDGNATTTNKQSESSTNSSVFSFIALDFLLFETQNFQFCSLLQTEDSDLQQACERLEVNASSITRSFNSSRVFSSYLFPSSKSLRFTRSGEKHFQDSATKISISWVIHQVKKRISNNLKIVSKAISLLLQLSQ